MCNFFIDVSAAELCLPESSQESTLQAEAEAAPETSSPKSTLNLSGLKAAFSSHHSSHSGNKAKAADSGPMQKTLQSFFKGPAKPSNFASGLKSPQKMASNPVKCSPGGRSVLDGFRYGTPCSDTDSDRESTMSRSNVAVEVPDVQMWSTETHYPEEKALSPTVKDELLKLTDRSSPPASEFAELQTESDAFKEECTRSPNAKRARTEEPHSPTEDNCSTISPDSEDPSIRLDAPVCVQKRALPLLFSIKELAARMKRLQHQRAQSSGEGLHYRRFKAKINPGENQSAEEELEKEIR